MEHVEEDNEVMMVPFLPLHESDTEEENLVEVVELSSRMVRLAAVFGQQAACKGHTKGCQLPRFTIA